MKVYMNRDNFSKRTKGLIKSNKEIYPKPRKRLQDELLPDVIEFIKDKEYTAICQIQSKFSIGFPRAYKIMNQLISDGIVVVEKNIK